MLTAAPLVSSLGPGDRFCGLAPEKSPLSEDLDEEGDRASLPPDWARSMNAQFLNLIIYINGLFSLLVALLRKPLQTGCLQGPA